MRTENFNHRPPRRWMKITIHIAESQSDIVASFLADLTGLGVEQSVAQPQPSTLLSVVTGYIERSDKLETLKKEIVSFLQHVSDQAPQILFEEIIEEDWGKKWKENYKPSRISKRITIKPTWEEYKGEADEIIIEIDPGLAFGTGLHASTRLALQLTEKVFDESAPQKVLDVGTGTGVLGMAAALLGSTKVTAIDNDPDAVVCTKENIAQNSLSALMSVSQTDLHALNEYYDLILANITSDVLTQMSTQLVSLLSSNGQLILAGILQGEQADLIQQTYSSLGLTLLDSPMEEEWQSFRFSK